MKNILDSRFEFFVNKRDRASSYMYQLLTDLGAKVNFKEIGSSSVLSSRWQESGLANITGYPDQPLLHCPVSIADYADGALQAFNILSRQNILSSYQGADLLTLRSTMTEQTRQGAISPGGSCRIIPCRDGTIAVNLARDCDWELINAWLQSEVAPDWEVVKSLVNQKLKSHILEQGRLLGLAVADAQPNLPSGRLWYNVAYRSKSATPNRTAPRVIDLSSLWAGPLCGKILQSAGAEVIKVESISRPDGARRGPAKFFNFLNDGKQNVVLDLNSKKGVSTLLDLIHSADIVIEASRPRALRQMGIIAEELLDSIAGLSWISITGYGRHPPEENWIAYGDDAGVAGGLSDEIYKATGRWMFCGDAIADPLTGLHSALAAYACWLSGGGKLLSLSLVKTVQNCVQTQLAIDHQMDHS